MGGVSIVDREKDEHMRHNAIIQATLVGWVGVVLGN